MKDKPKAKGPWIHRFAIRLLAVVLAVLVYWLLDFVVDDIHSIEGPRYDQIEKKHVDQALKEKRRSLEAKISDLSRQIDRQREKQHLIGDSTESLQLTMSQLLEVHRLSIQKGLALPETQQKNFTASLSLFLDNQKEYQQLNQTISGLVDRRTSLKDEKDRVENTIERQRRPARKEHDKLSRRHDLKLGYFQLAILIPLLVIAVVLIIKTRTSIYFPVFLALGPSVLLKVSLVIHEYFPTKMFKYVLIGVLLLAVAGILVHFIRSIAFPKVQWLIRQYREAYERFLCPVCEYPIRTGPRRFLYWTRRTVNKIIPPRADSPDQGKYACPACGTPLYEECEACHKIRHALLPFCERCGNEKSAIPGM